ECVYNELSETFSHTAIRIVNDVQKDIRESSCFKLLVERYQVKAGLAVPLMVGGELFGVLVAHQCVTPRPWTEFEQQLLQRLGTQVEIAIQQSELYHQIQTLNTNLEQQVADRTRELKQRTQELADRTCELEKRTQELEKLGQFRDFLLYAVTHDIRTTAVGMMMLLQSLDHQDGGSIHIPRRFFDKMLRAGNIQRDKLDAIQEVHTLEIQGISLNPTAISPHAMVREVIAVLQPRAFQNQATIVNQVPSSLPLLCGDVVQLQRVLQHLLTNAIAHNPPGVTITLQAQDQAQDHPSNTSFPPSKQSRRYVTFYIQDDGQGIAPEKCDRIFQLCASTDQCHHLGGISLGLYLCHQIITAHYGSIGIDSTVSQGTTVWFNLP
ncbi:MAG: GAF domain-containing protein, partial [Merismopedia sp. SIO2A8]|nr:GAF domain-containing protein [Merismopedia sp. SIO2A8]